jgi:ABC-type dipeptide/oligopeptide/nickel transport system permease subunit
MVEERVRLVRSEPFIEASRALGARDIHIVWKHVLPQINMLLPVMMAFEMAAALMLTAEIGFVGYYIGGTEFFDVPNGANPGATFFPTAGMPELGQMLSGGWHNFIQMPWLASWSGTAFFLTIFTFLMLGEGLKRYARDYRPGTARQRIAGLFGLPVRG